MKLIALALVLAAANTHAGPCTASDKWTGPDKTKHFAVGVALGAGGAVVFGNPKAGLLLGAGVGLAKEAWDRGQSNHTCSLQDFAATAAGAAAGAYGAGWLILPQRRGAVVAYAKTF